MAASATHAQDESDRRGTRIGINGGLASYQGDLQPNSFSFNQSRGFGGIYIRQSLSNRLSVRGGYTRASLFAADRNNRDYLKIRNLSFNTALNEGYVALDYELLSLSQRRFTPFGYAGLAYFHFNPYTFDEAGEKVFLQPLGTEGQGLSRYPDRTMYSRSQLALAFGGGFRIAVSDAIQVNLELHERKTFTDYLDDVSTTFADEQALLDGRGPKAVALAFRGDEIPGGGTYPKEGDQRGTPTQMDWYYMAGLSVEIKLSALKRNEGRRTFSRHGGQVLGCPKL